MMIWSDHDMGGWGYAGMAVGMVLFWVLLIFGIVALIRFSLAASTAGSVLPRRHTESPEQLLAMRFARGDIDETEYQQRLAVLRSTAGA